MFPVGTNGLELIVFLKILLENSPPSLGVVSRLVNPYKCMQWECKRWDSMSEVVSITRGIGGIERLRCHTVILSSIKNILKYIIFAFVLLSLRPSMNLFIASLPDICRLDNRIVFNHKIITIGIIWSPYS